MRMKHQHHQHINVTYVVHINVTYVVYGENYMKWGLFSVERYYHNR
jgi:hypothetical protein